MNGILSGMPPGILDPRNAALMQTGLGLLQASGPSRTPVGLGQALGQAGMQGLNAFQQTNQANQQNQLYQLKLAEVEREAAERKKKDAAVAQLRTDPRFANLGPLLDVAPAAAIERAIPKPKETPNPFSRLDPKDYTPESLTKFQQTGNVADLVVRPPAPPAPPSSIREYEFAKSQGYQGSYEQWDRERRKAGAPSVTVDQRGEDSYFKQAGKELFNRDLGLYESAQSAADNVLGLRGLIKHLKTSDAITGLGAELRLQVDRVKALVAQNKAAGKRVSDTELLDAFLGQDVFPMIKALGIGARGLDTPAEREFLRKVMSGTIPMNQDTLVRLSEYRLSIGERAVERFNKKVERGEMDRFFRAQGMKPQKIELPKEESSPPDAPKPDGQVFDKLPSAVRFKGKTVRDTETGKLYKSDGMSWKEVKQ